MASFKERIDECKSELDALITYSNETTEASDTTIGDCIETLVQGYGQGGTPSEVFLSSFIGTGDRESPTISYDKEWNPHTITVITPDKTTWSGSRRIIWASGEYDDSGARIGHSYCDAIIGESSYDYWSNALTYTLSNGQLTLNVNMTFGDGITYYVMIV